MSFNVLIIEDDVQLNFVISEYFKMKGYNTHEIYDGLEAIDTIDKFKVNYIDLYVIDINLPSLTGLDVLKYIREKDSRAAIIIITASLEVKNFINAFEYGCSDYIKKPFHIKELEVRVDKLLTNNSSKIEFTEDFYYSFITKEFYHKDKKIELRNKERRLVEVLLQNINKIVPPEVVFDYVWETEPKESYPIRQLLAALRKKLPYNIIETKVRQGYKIESPNGQKI
ncbi:MAG: response regulator transcription factor [Campylobacterales bacterium]|nr:response regulator transcription factor [Campylobacterales bacterium]